MSHEIRQSAHLIVRLQLRTYRRMYRDRYCFVVPHAQHECFLGLWAQHERFVTLVEIAEHEKRNIAYPKRIGKFIAIRMGADWILRMGPSNRQASGYKLQPHLLPPHFTFDGGRF